MQRREGRLAALAEAIRRECRVAVHTVTQDVRDLAAVGRLPEELPEEFKVGRGLRGAWLRLRWLGPRMGWTATGRQCSSARLPKVAAASHLPHNCLPAQDVELLVPNAGLALGVAPIHEADLDDAQASCVFTSAWLLRSSNSMFALSLCSHVLAGGVQAMIETNVTSVVTLLRAFTPGMVQRNSGHIIFIGRCPARAF